MHVQNEKKISIKLKKKKSSETRNIVSQPTSNTFFPNACACMGSYKSELGKFFYINNKIFKLWNAKKKI